MHLQLALLCPREPPGAPLGLKPGFSTNLPFLDFELHQTDEAPNNLVFVMEEEAKVLDNEGPAAYPAEVVRDVEQKLAALGTDWKALA